MNSHRRRPQRIFNHFLIAYGGQNIVTKDGKLHLDDPQVREAAIKALTYPTTAYKEGFVPPARSTGTTPTTTTPSTPRRS